VVSSSMNPVGWLREQLETADVDLLREMVRTFAEALMGAEVEAICGAGYGEVSQERVNRRNGYRDREWDTRVGTIDLAIPKLRSGSYFPSWLLEPRRRAEQALVQVIADCYLAGVSTRRVDKLVKQLGIDGISKSQVSELAKSLDEHVAAWRSRPLEGTYPYVWMDALTQKVREGGRVVNVAVVHAVGVNAAGYRETLGIDVVTSEDGAGWTAFLRGLVARGLSGVQLVISDAHRRLEGRDRGDPARRQLATMQNPLHAQPADQGPQVRPRARRPARADDLRTTRRRHCLGAARPRGGAAHRPLRRRRGSAR